MYFKNDRGFFVDWNTNCIFEEPELKPLVILILALVLIKKYN